MSWLETNYGLPQLRLGLEFWDLGLGLQVKAFGKLTAEAPSMMLYIMLSFRVVSISTVPSA